eukprot:1142788-Pelagomonas_calceolata.AAC.2
MQKQLSKQPNKGKESAAGKMSALLTKNADMLNFPLVMKSCSAQTISNLGYLAEETLPTLTKEKGDTLAQKSRKSPPPRSYKKKTLVGIWRVTGSAWLHNLAAKSIRVFSSTPSGNKLVGVHNRVGMKFTSKLNGTQLLGMVFLGWKADSADSACCSRSGTPVFQLSSCFLFSLLDLSFFSQSELRGGWGMLSVTGPTNTQGDGNGKAYVRVKHDVTYKAKLTPSSPSSTHLHHALRSRHNPTQRTTRANR